MNNRTLTLIIGLGLASLAVIAAETPGRSNRQNSTPVLRTTQEIVEILLNGSNREGISWHVSPETDPDIFDTSAGTISFASDIDTVTLEVKEWQSAPLNILTAAGDTAHVLVKRSAADPYTNPNPELLKIAPSGLLSRQQVQFDIDALIYTIDQVHPDIFSTCRQADLMRTVNAARKSLPDSLTITEAYKVMAPLVAMIGDGHTNLFFPGQQVFVNAKALHMPVYMDVASDGTITCQSSLDSIIPRGAKILSVNGIPSSEIIESMLPYVSGERRPFRLARINNSFSGLYYTLYKADSYDVEYLPQGAKRPMRHTFEPVDFTEAKRRCPTRKNVYKKDYSFTIDEANNVAVMDFPACNDVDNIEAFADSMFSTLRRRHIGNLIIDARANGGGSNYVGDVLLKYISPKPFTQISKGLVKVTPTTLRLLGSSMSSTTLTYGEADSTWYDTPYTREQGHYDGRVIVLSSNATFSAGASFVWTFKECGAGMVIGEETGGMNVCYGEILTYALPVSKIVCGISYKRFWQMNAEEDNIHGAIPDIAVKAEDALDTALQYIKKHEMTTAIDGK